MPGFSDLSRLRLNTCHPKIIRVLEEAIKHNDFSVICGHRGEAEQNEAFNKGTSKLKWPDSKHNSAPSRAVDIAPYPVDWKDLKRFYFLAGLVLGLATQMGIKLAWGGFWKSFPDFPHFELDESEE